MSFISESPDAVHTKYINPVYVTAITSPAAVHTLLPLSSAEPLLTYCHKADWTSQLSSAHSRSCRRRTEFPYVARRAGINSHKGAAKSEVNGVIKSMRKLKFRRISYSTNELYCGSSQTQADDNNVQTTDCSRPSLLDDFECSSSLDVLNIVDDCNSTVNGDRSLNVVVKTLSNLHVTE